MNNEETSDCKMGSRKLTTELIPSPSTNVVTDKPSPGNTESSDLTLICDDTTVQQQSTPISTVADNPLTEVPEDDRQTTNPNLHAISG